jgi:hypothetical protein
MEAKVQGFGVMLLGLAAIAFCVYLVSSAAQTQDTYDAKRKSFSHNEGDCKAAGGVWSHGPFGEFICQRITADHDKQCNSSADCEGACLGDEQAGPNVRVGRCSAQLLVYGCNVEVERHGTWHVCRD